jgi:hypothetical protein
MRQWRRARMAGILNLHVFDVQSISQFQDSMLKLKIGD